MLLLNVLYLMALPIAKTI